MTKSFLRKGRSEPSWGEDQPSSSSPGGAVPQEAGEIPEGVCHHPEEGTSLGGASGD